MSTGASTDGYVLAEKTLQETSIERRARWGRVLLWALIVNVGFAGVIGPYLLPEKLYLLLATTLGGDYVHQGAVLAQGGWMDIGHRLLGMALLVTGMFQFDPQLRRSRPVLHRWTGRIFLSLTLVVSATALIIGVLYPFGGLQETVFVVAVCALLLWFAASAWQEVRRRRFVQHREWMIRALGLCFFVSLQRLFYILMVVATDWPNREAFVTAGWLAVLVALIAAEYWINLTRTGAAPGRSA